MFNYSIQVKITAIVVLLALIATLSMVVVKEKSQGFDLYKVSYAQNIATSLERYFDKHNEYPELEKISLSDIQIITENGVNQAGDYLYFSQSKRIVEGTLISKSDRYIIEFSLDNSWNLWGIGKKGGLCRVSNNLDMICRSNG